MHVVLDNGTPYQTPGPGECIAPGMIVGTPDGRAAEVISAPDAKGWLRARPWDTARAFDYRTADVYAWIETV